MKGIAGELPHLPLSLKSMMGFLKNETPLQTKRKMVSECGRRRTKKQLHPWLCFYRSSFYGKPTSSKRSAKPGTRALTTDERATFNEQNVYIFVSDTFSQELNPHCYQLNIEELMSMGYIIDPQKTYRLMRKHSPLLEVEIAHSYDCCHPYSLTVEMVILRQHIEKQDHIVIYNCSVAQRKSMTDVPGQEQSITHPEK